MPLPRYCAWIPLALALGCASPEAPAEVPPSTSEASAPANPLSPASGAQPRTERVAVTVLEVLPAGSYTYLKVQGPEGEPAWMAVLKTRTEPGARLEIVTLATREAFYSKRLDRTFDRVTFGIAF